MAASSLFLSFLPLLLLSQSDHGQQLDPIRIVAFGLSRYVLYTMLNSLARKTSSAHRLLPSDLYPDPLKKPVRR
jgi:hypothetical protein